jgi:hypothetical protein
MKALKGIRMTDTKRASNLPIAIAIVLVAAIAAGVYLYQKKQESQQTFTMSIGGHTISATVEGEPEGK